MTTPELPMMTIKAKARGRPAKLETMFKMDMNRLCPFGAITVTARAVIKDSTRPMAVERKDSLRLFLMAAR